MFSLEKLKAEGYSKFTLEEYNLKKDLLDGTIKLFKSVSNSKIKNFTLSDMVEIYNNDKSSWNRFYEICSNQSGIFKILSSESIMNILNKCNYKHPGIQKSAVGLRFDFPNTEKTRFLPHQDLPYNMGGFDNLIQFEDFEEIFVEENEGVIFSTTLIHSSGKNECDIPRITLLGRYFDYYDQSFIERDFNPTPMKFKK